MSILAERQAADFIQSLRTHRDGRLKGFSKRTYYCCSDCGSNFGAYEVEKLLALFKLHLTRKNKKKTTPRPSLTTTK